MKKRLYLGLLFALVLLLCACASAAPEPGTTPPATEPPTIQTTVPTTAPATEPTQLPTETTAPAHSALYLPEYTTEDILKYFQEVALSMEYSDGTGDTALVQKWLAPIRYRIHGSPTEEDLAVLNDLFAQLNGIPGFPGIRAAAEEEPSELTLSFLDPDSFRLAFSAMLNGEEAFGAAQFWYYTATNEIHTANIGYRTDIDQAVRSSILPEEIINSLGISDTELRTDSIVYQYSDDNTSLSDVDWIILNLLYDPAIQCGMDLDACREIIEDLYY